VNKVIKPANKIKPWIAGMSNISIFVIAHCPIPFQAKTVSIIAHAPNNPSNNIAT
jgi:hypothetical protein